MRFKTVTPRKLQGQILDARLNKIIRTRRDMTVLFHAIFRIVVLLQIYVFYILKILHLKVIFNSSKAEHIDR